MGDIVAVIIFSAIIAFIAFGMLWMAIVWPICNYYVRRPNNLVQWEAVETEQSHANYDRQITNKRLFDLYYRILPSDLNLFVRIFGDNEWHLKYDSQGRFHWIHP